MSLLHFLLPCSCVVPSTCPNTACHSLPRRHTNQKMCIAEGIQRIPVPAVTAQFWYGSDNFVEEWQLLLTVTPLYS
ncbi:hypothetical protein CWRG_02293 [Chthonomonas calidirosea]|nr:hypothetical protein CWRG_02293 [Chthonomonas calidirosea]CEK18810.1 hypothetical protein CP488_02311 [Chthonomonas calidirosea]